MSNTYTQIHVQLVFAVKNRDGLINKTWQSELHAYITGIIQRNNHKMLQINSMRDHIHILIGMRPHQSLSAMVQNVKSETTKWIKEKGFCANFRWQEGFGAFSYSKAGISNVIAYIKNQEVHHTTKSFNEEYTDLLNEFEIDWDSRYIFNEPQ